MFNTVIDSIRRWRLEENTRRELRRLNDRQLADIGITRFDIDSVARGRRRGA